MAAGDACGELESTKSVSDIFCPVPGVITAVNAVAGPPTQRPSTPIRTGTAGSSSSSWTRARTSTTCWMLIPMRNRWQAESTGPPHAGLRLVLNSPSRLEPSRL